MLVVRAKNLRPDDGKYSDPYLKIKFENYDAVKYYIIFRWGG